MRKAKPKEAEKIEICECLRELLEAELKLGNSIGQYTATSNWPHPNSKYIALKNDLKTDIKLLNHAQNISYQICRDPHYGWHDECECLIHQDMLCAGNTKPFSST